MPPTVYYSHYPLVVHWDGQAGDVAGNYAVRIRVCDSHPVPVSDPNCFPVEIIYPDQRPERLKLSLEDLFRKFFRLFDYDGCEIRIIPSQFDEKVLIYVLKKLAEKRKSRFLAEWSGDSRNGPGMYEAYINVTDYAFNSRKHPSKVAVELRFAVDEDTGDKEVVLSDPRLAFSGPPTLVTLAGESIHTDELTSHASPPANSTPAQVYVPTPHLNQRQPAHPSPLTNQIGNAYHTPQRYSPNTYSPYSWQPPTFAPAHAPIHAPPNLSGPHANSSSPNLGPGAQSPIASTASNGNPRSFAPPPPFPSTTTPWHPHYNPFLPSHFQRPEPSQPWQAQQFAASHHDWIYEQPRSIPPPSQPPPDTTPNPKRVLRVGNMLRSGLFKGFDKSKRHPDSVEVPRMDNTVTKMHDTAGKQRLRGTPVCVSSWNTISYGSILLNDFLDETRGSILQPVAQRAVRLLPSQMSDEPPEVSASTDLGYINMSTLLHRYGGEPESIWKSAVTGIKTQYKNRDLLTLCGRTAVHESRSFAGSGLWSRSMSFIVVSIEDVDTGNSRAKLVTGVLIFDSTAPAGDPRTTKSCVPVRRMVCRPFLGGFRVKADTIVGLSEDAGISPPMTKSLIEESEGERLYPMMTGFTKFRWQSARNKPFAKHIELKNAIDTADTDLLGIEWTIDSIAWRYNLRNADKGYEGMEGDLVFTFSTTTVTRRVTQVQDALTRLF